MSDLMPMLKLDLRNVAGSRRFLLAFLAIAVLLAAWGGPQMATPLVAMAGYMTAMNLFQLDEAHRLRLLYGALPVPRRTVMASHYLTSIGLVLAAVLLGLVLLPIAALARGEVAEGSFAGMAVVAAVLLAALGLVLPAVVRFGTKASSYAVLVAIALVSGGVVLLSDTEFASGLLAAAGALPGWLVWLAPPIVALMLWGSFELSARIYQRQDH